MTSTIAYEVSLAVIRKLRESGIEPPALSDEVSEEHRKLIADTIMEEYEKRGVVLHGSMREDIVGTLMRALSHIGKPSVHEAIVPGVLACLRDAIGEIDTSRRGIMGLLRELAAQKDEASRLVTIGRAAGMLQLAHTGIAEARHLIGNAHGIDCECDDSEKATEPPPAGATEAATEVV